MTGSLPFLSATAQFIFLQRQRELIMCDTEGVSCGRKTKIEAEKKNKKKKIHFRFDMLLREHGAISWFIRNSG